MEQGALPRNLVGRAERAVRSVYEVTEPAGKIVVHPSGSSAEEYLRSVRVMGAPPQPMQPAHQAEKCFARQPLKQRITNKGERAMIWQRNDQLSPQKT
ncbi:MAG TPA: hypothetical protein VIR56_01670 [Solimonas sp.]